MHHQQGHLLGGMVQAKPHQLPISAQIYRLGDSIHGFLMQQGTVCATET
jgi:hypothetical protein